jgi:two-component system phosphate regulon sensor histidine kinase PhoR
MHYFPKKFFLRQALFHTLLGLLAIYSTTMIGRYYLKDYVEHQLKYHARKHLKDLLHISQLQSLSPQQWCHFFRNSQQEHLKQHDHDSLETFYRYTLLSKTGHVLCDSHADAKKMANHLDRPEVQKAFLESWGEDTRLGQTLTQKTYYLATLLPSSSHILRLAFPLDPVYATFASIDQTIWIRLAPIFLIISLLIVFQALVLSRGLSPLIEKANLIEKEHQKEEQREKLERQEQFTAEDSSLTNLPTSMSSQEKYQEKHQEKHQEEWELLDQAIDHAYGDIKKLQQLLKQEKKSFRLLLNAIHVAIMGVDDQLQGLFKNKTFEKHFTLPQLFQQHPHVLQAFQQVIQQGQIVGPISIEVPSHHPHEGSLFFSVWITPFVSQIFQKKLSAVSSTLTQKGEHLTNGAIGIFYDQTKQKLLDQIRSDFVANVSHELRTPLSSIIGSLDLLRGEQHSWPIFMQQHLERIQRNADKMTVLMRDLLTLSLLEGPQDHHEEEWITLEDFFLDLKSTFEHQSSQKILSWSFSFDVKEIWVSSYLFEMTINNILENAYKYVPSGGKISMGTTFVESGQTKDVLLKIQDNGPGFPAILESRIFERFFRCPSVQEQQIPGTGLGLSIVRHAVLQMKGKVWAESEEGKGACFYLQFPYPMTPKEVEL